MLVAGVLVAMVLVLPVAAENSVVVRDITISGNSRTRTEVIRREILFEPGDTLTAALVEETSRNLRALLFLGEVTVDVSRMDGYADVHVHVTDLYARAITPLLSGEPDELSYGGVGLDYNFLGRGQIVELTAEHDAVKGDRVRVLYREPRVGGGRVRLYLDGEIGAEGHRAVVRVSRPFFRLSEAWSVGGTGYIHESVTRLYAGQTVSEKYRSIDRGGSVSFRRSFGDKVKVRPGIFFSVNDLSFDSEPGFTYAPAGRRRVLPSVGVMIWKPEYETIRFFSLLGRTEDLQIGSWVSFQLGVSTEALRSDRDYLFMTLDVNPRTKLSPFTYLLSRVTLRARYSQGRVWNVFGSAEAKMLEKIRGIHAIVTRVRFDAVARPEETTQYLLGSERGLRGYAARRFDGTRRLLFNIEGRSTLKRHRFFTLAGVVFVDGGSAWMPETESRNLVWAAGVGVRVGMNRVYNSPVLRADVGYGFADQGWVLFVGLGQYF